MTTPPDMTPINGELLEALQAIADESVFNQMHFAEDTDTDYFLRCFRAVKDRARAAIARASTQPPILDVAWRAIDALRVSVALNQTVDYIRGFDDGYIHAIELARKEIEKLGGKPS